MTVHVGFFISYSVFFEIVLSLSSGTQKYTVYDKKAFVNKLHAYNDVDIHTWAGTKN